MTETVPVERLVGLFDLNQNTGELRWKTSPSNSVRRGSIVGNVDKDGYITVQILRKKYFAHRIVWAIFNGCWPVGVIDHINGIRSDNRVCNLRDVSAKINTQNTRTARSSSKSGLLGAHARSSGSFRAQITANGVQHRLGDFSSPEDAHAAYISAKRHLHDGCTI